MQHNNRKTLYFKRSTILQYKHLYQNSSLQKNQSNTDNRLKKKPKKHPPPDTWCRTPQWFPKKKCLAQLFIFKLLFLILNPILFLPLVGIIFTLQMTESKLNTSLLKGETKKYTVKQISPYTHLWGYGVLICGVSTILDFAPSQEEAVSSTNFQTPVKTGLLPCAWLFPHLFASPDFKQGSRERWANF